MATATAVGGNVYVPDCARSLPASCASAAAARLREPEMTSGGRPAAARRWLSSPMSQRSSGDTLCSPATGVRFGNVIVTVWPLSPAVTAYAMPFSPSGAPYWAPPGPAWSYGTRVKWTTSPGCSV